MYKLNYLSWKVETDLNLHFQMEGLVREMKDEETGVRVKSQKLFLTSIPSAFAGTYYNKNFIVITR